MPEGNIGRLREGVEGKPLKHTIAEVHASSVRHLSKVEAAGDPTDGADEDQASSLLPKGEQQIDIEGLFHVVMNQMINVIFVKFDCLNWVKQAIMHYCLFPSRNPVGP